MPNRLAAETSPYLLQHAENPVDWYPWGAEAFERAAGEGKPVLLSVGYSSCHWCHVMAHESFEDPETARLMNDLFVNIKVDREERPDVDSVYMSVTQAMTGSGGWPMTVFMTPEAEPFYAGTYFPPEDNYGKPGFKRVLASIASAWERDRNQIVESARQVLSELKEQSARMASAPAATPGLTRRAVDQLRTAFDQEWGGFGEAPKFPSPSNLEFLLMHGALHRDDGSLGPTGMALHTLKRMARGGIYDHIGDGFSRYSVDRFWLVPHFEKMLYDNAQLIRALTHAWQITGDHEYLRTTRGTCAYLEREMLHPGGGFYSAQDADSEGIEGKFFVWTPAEFREVLGEEAEFAMACYGVTERGNFQDPHHPEFGSRNVLSFQNSREAAAKHFGMEPDAFEARLQSVRSKLFEARESRVHPGLDDKVLASWNGLALAAFAEAGRALQDDHLLGIARRNAEFLRDEMWAGGRLFHTWKDGVARVDGMLEDYAFVGLGLVELYCATGDLAHLDWARELLDALGQRFHDDEAGGFFETATDGERLVLPQKPQFDSATPSGNSAAALLAAWLGRYYGDPALTALAEEVVRLAGALPERAPSGFGCLLQVVELLEAPHREVAIVGAASARRPFESEVARRFLPATLIAPAESGEGLPVLDGRGEPGLAVAYVCEDMACQLPARDPVQLSAQLESSPPTETQE